MIYILRTQFSMDKFIKVGFTDVDVQARIRKLQTGCPTPIELLLTLEGTLTNEKNIHQALWRYRASGEWFRLCSETIAALAALGITLPSDKRDPPKGRTSMKSYLNHHFKDRYYPDHVWPRRLSEFCLEMNYDPEVVESLQSSRSKFFIQETTTRFIYERLGYTLGEINDDLDKFIFPLNIVNLHKINKIQEEISKRFTSELSRPLLP